MNDYNDEILKNGDRVRSIYISAEPNNIGTIVDDNCIIYDDEPETEYLILDSRYLIKISNKTKEEKLKCTNQIVNATKN